MIGSEKIFCLKYADDVAIEADTEDGMRDMIKELEKYTQNNELSINCTKSKIMCFRNRGRRKKNIDWYINKQKIDQVNNIKYLGYLFNENNNTIVLFNINNI